MYSLQKDSSIDYLKSRFIAQVYPSENNNDLKKTPKFQREAELLFRRKPPATGHLVLASTKMFQCVSDGFTERRTTNLDEASRW